MPIHDYHCEACSAEFELLVRGSQAPVCPHCGSASLQRRISLPAPKGRAGAIVAAGRRAAAREGHFSHYSGAERAKLR